MFWPFIDPFYFFGVPTLQSDQQPDRAHLFTLVTKPKRAPHKWMGGGMVPRAESLSGLEQREWACLNCNLIKVTVLFDAGTQAERAYRYQKSDVQFAEDIEPSCRVDLVTEAKAS